MPFYEYECPSCRYYLEVLQKISDRPLKKCPSCGKSGFKRLVSAPVFRLKGAGWYETDFKSDKEGQRNLAGKEPAEAKPEAGAAKAGAEDKGAGKPDTAAAPVDKSKAESAAKAAETGKSGTRKSARASSSARSAGPKRGAKRTVRKAARGRARR